MPTHPIPADYPQLGPSIAVRDCAAAIEFYKQAFGAIERMRLNEPSGKVGHAELQFGTGLLMLCDKYEGYNFTPDDLGGKTTVVLHLYVEDVDATVARAVEAGARLVLPVADQFYGDRSGRVQDPYGHVWLIASRIENMPPEEMKKRAAEAMKS
jgi:PhnB protein